MKITKFLSLGLLLTTTACVVGPPVENEREKRVERGMENNHHKKHNNKHNHGNHGYGHDHDHDDDDDFHDPLGNYDQDHDRIHRSN
jgi:hypothetical protein